MDDRKIAIEAIAEGWYILWLLSTESDEEQWMINSIPLAKLDRLATELGYFDARSLRLEVERIRELYGECE